MKRTELRAQARIKVSQRAMLNSGEPAWFPCMVVDASDHGFLILCNKTFSVGQILQLRGELVPQKTLDCKIEVRQATDSEMGAKIVEIDNKGTGLLQMYLQEQYSGRLR